MLLKSLAIKNIRSYTSQEITFPLGSVLLAGDIGSGKSTILLAIEFALFGIKASELTGTALLRHGTKEGAVELRFEVDGKEITVKRTLKRMADKINQGPGYLLVDGAKTDLMPKEIRAKVFEFLNYPQSMVTKAEDLIYRFTVYTPQEQMKKIIYEDKDTRLDTLRKVFNMDKYKRIRENAIIYIRALKEKRSNFEGRTEDLEDKKLQKEEQEKHINELKDKEAEAKLIMISAKEKTNARQSSVTEIEEKIKKFTTLKRDIALVEVEVRTVLEQRERNKKDVDTLQNDILKVREELKEFTEEHELQGIYQDKERRLDTVDKEIRSLRNQKAVLQGKIMNLKQMCDKIARLDNCPLCMQNVPHEHKSGIIKKCNEEIASYDAQTADLDRREKESVSFFEALKKELKELQLKINQQKVLQLKKENLSEKEKRLAAIRELVEHSKKRIGELNTKRIELTKEISQYSDIDKKYADMRKEYELLLNDERKKELEHNSLVKEIETLTRQLGLLAKEIQEKEKTKKELKKIISMQNFIQDKFINLVNVIEKHVMMTVYHEFNELFQRWFSMLVEDESMTVRLDDTFSVIVEQNGYETTVDNLSGGEKTSVALAYRLALNKVINDVVSEIKTKDLIILDEPTEGFSTAQLDRVRDVLEQLANRQIIIVSHEGKIESFVDNVIRVHKREGVSEVSS